VHPWVQNKTRPLKRKLGVAPTEPQFAPNRTYFAPKCTQCKTKAVSQNGSPGLYHFLSHSTKKHRNFDTMGIRISVFFFCLKVLILLAFGLLMYQQPSDKTIASATQRL